MYTSTDQTPTRPAPTPSPATEPTTMRAVAQRAYGPAEVLHVETILTFFISTESLEFIEPLATHLADGTVTPTIGHRYDLDQVPTAIAAMEAGEVTGKAVIKERP